MRLVESDDAVGWNKKPIRATVGDKSGGDRRARPVAAFLRVVARHGAAMARHGRPPSPAPAIRPVRFSRITGHEKRITAFTHGRSVRCGWARVAPPETVAGPPRPPASHCFPVHHCSLLFTIVHHCSLLFAIVQQKNISHETVSVYRQPFSVGLETSAVSSRITPCRERGTFWIAPTAALSLLR